MRHQVTIISLRMTPHPVAEWSSLITQVGHYYEVFRSQLSEQTAAGLGAPIKLYVAHHPSLHLTATHNSSVTSHHNPWDWVSPGLWYWCIFRDSDSFAPHQQQNGNAAYY